MKVKDLINVINSFGVNVIFDNPRDKNVIKRCLSGNCPVYFTPVEEKEREEYEKSNNKSEFVSNTAAIHIIDLSIDDLIDTFKCDGTGVHNGIKQIISPYCNGVVSEDIVYVIFLFLHEVGHWQQFMAMHRKVLKFINQDFLLKKSLFEEIKATYNDPIKLQKCGKKYRKIPAEKEADKFALEHIQDILNKYYDQKQKNKRKYRY